MGSRGVYRGIHSSLLDDPDFQRLSAKARHVLLTARLCRDAGLACIFRYYPAVLMLQTGYTRRQVDEALVELAGAHWVYVDGAVLWIRNGLRHDPHVKLVDKKHLSGVLRQLEALPASPLVVKFYEYYEIARASHGPHKGLGRVGAVWLQEKEKEKEKEKKEGGDAAQNLPASSAPDQLSQKGRGAVDQAFVEQLRPLYPGVDVDREVKKLKAWLLTPRGHGKAFSRQRMVNWLNKCEPEKTEVRDPYENFPSLYDCVKCGKAHAQRECDGLDAEESITKWEKARRK